MRRFFLHTGLLAASLGLAAPAWAVSPEENGPIPRLGYDFSSFPGAVPALCQNVGGVASNGSVFFIYTVICGAAPLERQLLDFDRPFIRT